MALSEVQGVPRNMTVGELFECLLSFTVLDSVLDFSQYNSLKNL